MSSFPLEVSRGCWYVIPYQHPPPLLGPPEETDLAWRASARTAGCAGTLA